MRRGNFDTSEYKVTYLLGAGASARQLPTIKGSNNSDGLAHMLKHLSNDLKFVKNLKAEHKAFIDDIAKDLDWLGENSLKFGTPDTFSKFLYLKEKEKLDRLKKALSFYFTYEQFIKGKQDIRALIFLTTIMQIGSIFPSNIKILNWNYDFQIQLAAKTFREEQFKNISGTTVHKPPLIQYYPSLGNEMIVNNIDNKYDSISMVHLNGIAGFFFEKEKELILNHFLNEPPQYTHQLIDTFLKEKDKKHDLLTFAWEEQTEASRYLRKRVEIAKNMIRESDILVVIGCSFPFFNREMDKQIFETLKASENFKKIYYQDPYRTGEFLKNQFGLSDDIEIYHISDTENYFVPLEL